MLNQQTGLRAWLSTGDERFLASVALGRRQVETQNDRLVDLLQGDAKVDRAVLDLRLDEEAWLEGWAEGAALVDPDQLDAVALGALLAEDERLFAAYRRTQVDLNASFSALRDQALDQERASLVVGAGAEVVLCAALLVFAQRRRRRMESSLVAPFADLRNTMHRMAEGDLTARPNGQGPQEIREIGSGLVEMAEALVKEQERLSRRESEHEHDAGRLREILGLARDLAGTLCVRTIAESLAATAGRACRCDQVLVWLLDDGSTLTALHDSRLPPGSTPSLAPVTLGGGVVGEAARDARIVSRIEDEGVALAVPLVVGGRVIGVIEMLGCDEAVGPTAMAMLESLALHAAGAVENARLHDQAEELSQLDGLTGLLNRRRLDADLELECDRSLRYGRPLAFILLDLDHFKQLNDELGHQHGDDVLRQVAELLAGAVRSSDTVYRYGGEELAVLVREGSADSATELAERLRRLFETSFVDRTALGPVTASFGVAALADGWSASDLVAAADGALYEAKRGGRNQVALAGAPLALTASPVQV